MPLMVCMIAACVQLVPADQWDTTRFEYESGTGRLVRKIYPDGKAISYTYHYGELPKRIMLASGKWKERFYDSRLNVTSNVYSSQNTPDVHIVPNEFGTPILVSDAAGLVYEYGIRSRGQILTNETVTSPWMNWTLGHSHDPFSRETGWTLSVDGDEKGEASLDYDGNGRVRHVTCVNAAGRSVAVTYTNAFGYSHGYEIATPSGGIFRQEVTRDPYRRELVTRLQNMALGHTVFDCSYSYDARGSLVRRTDLVNSSTDCYSYNGPGELVAADIAGSAYAFGYDGIGNCRWSSVGGTTNYYLYNGLNQCLAKIHSGGDLQDYIFDDDGNLTHVSDEESYVWDCENRLIAIDTPNGSVTNCYDYQGRLLKQILPDAVRTCIFDRWNLIYEKIEQSDGAVLERQYFWGADRSGTLDKACGVGGLIAVSINGVFYFPCYGSNSEITAYVSESGTVVATYTYGPFGEMTLSAGSMSDQFVFRFMTKRYDTAVNLYDFGARWYSPTLRRWLNRDPLGEDGGLNLYVFCNNDPVNKFDPNGCIPLDTIWDIGNVVYDIIVGDDVALVADTAALFVPYVPAGATKLVKAARLSKVEKICPGVKKLEVTYKYHPYNNYHFQYRTAKPPVSKNWNNLDWVVATKNGKAQFRPGFTHEDAKRLVESALQEAKSQGMVKPSQLDKYVFDAGSNIGAHNGNPTSLIQLKVTPQGEIHLHPISPDKSMNMR